VKWPNILAPASGILAIAISVYLVVPVSTLYGCIVGVELVYAEFEIKRLEVDGLEAEFLERWGQATS